MGNMLSTYLHQEETLPYEEVLREEAPGQEITEQELPEQQASEESTSIDEFSEHDSSDDEASQDDQPSYSPASLHSWKNFQADVRPEFQHIFTKLRWYHILLTDVWHVRAASVLSPTTETMYDAIQGKFFQLVDTLNGIRVAIESESPTNTIPSRSAIQKEYDAVKTAWIQLQIDLISLALEFMTDAGSSLYQYGRELSRLSLRFEVWWEVVKLLLDDAVEHLRLTEVYETGDYDLNSFKDSDVEGLSDIDSVLGTLGTSDSSDVDSVLGSYGAPGPSDVDSALGSYGAPESSQAVNLPLTHELGPEVTGGDQAQEREQPDVSSNDEDSSNDEESVASLVMERLRLDPNRWKPAIQLC